MMAIVRRHYSGNAKPVSHWDRCVEVFAGANPVYQSVAVALTFSRAYTTQKSRLKNQVLTTSNRWGLNLVYGDKGRLTFDRVLMAALPP